MYVKDIINIINVIEQLQCAGFYEGYFMCVYLFNPQAVTRYSHYGCGIEVP